MHRVGIHDPGHYLRVRVDIGGRDIAPRPNNDGYLRGIAASQTLQLRRAHYLGVADDTTFRAAIGDTNDGGFPGHPHCQRLDLVEGYIRTVTDTTFCRAAIHVVLNTIAGKCLDTAVV